MKGFLNHHPTPEEMAYWSRRQGISIEQTTSFTDGTKVQIEQVVVGNGLGATITRQGLEGLASTSLNDTADVLGLMAERTGQPIVDYVVPSGYPAGGVFLVCRHDEEQAPAIQYFKLGAGPYYVLVRPFHLCSLEVGKTVRRVLHGGGVLLNNSTQPTLGVAAIAKHAMKAGELIERGIGGYQFRGEAIRLADNPNYVPIGLLRKTALKRAVEPGQLITFDDVDILPSRALDIVDLQRHGLLQAERDPARRRPIRWCRSPWGRWPRRAVEQSTLATRKAAKRPFSWAAEGGRRLDEKGSRFKTPQRSSPRGRASRKGKRCPPAPVGGRSRSGRACGIHPIPVDCVPRGDVASRGASRASCQAVPGFSLLPREKVAAGG